jgi:type IV pilus assembly protein PilC
MPLFICKIGAADGKIIEKEFEAATADILKQNLVAQGFYVFSVSKKPLQFLWNRGVSRKRIDTKSLITFNQEFLVLIKSGLPIIQTFDTILERIDKGRLAEVLEVIRDDIKGGSSLSDAFERHPSAFSHLYIASIRAGERTGDLPQTLRRYITFLKKTEGFRKKVLTALFYPAILTTVAFLAVTLLLVYVVPTFSQVYADAGSKMPLPTLILINFTAVLKRYFLVLVGLVFFAMYLFRRWVATAPGRYALDAFTLKIPVIGDIFAKYSIVSFTRTLATIIESGIPIVESLKMSLGTLNNKVLEERLAVATKRVEEGVSISVAIEGAQLMPSLALRMLSVGESTGSLEEMLETISDYFEEELDQRLLLLSTAIEPAIMIVMGIVIGAIIITMYLPIFKIAGTID